MRPPKEDIYDMSREQIVDKYGVSEKTAVRWLKHYGLFESKITRLSQEQAKEIRERYLKNEPVKWLAEEYGVTLSTIYRVVNRTTHNEFVDTAKVSVSYNPN